MKYNYEKMKRATILFLEAIGEDLEREGLQETPDRVAKMYQIMLGGYDVDNGIHVKTFKAEAQDMVVLSNISFVSYCEHHLGPFLGKMHIGYIPRERVVGVSKLVRIARTHCKKLQIQERLVKEIADDLEQLLQPQGAGVRIQALHTCLTLRGVRAHGSIMTVSAMRGIFQEDPKVRSEFLDTIKEKESVYGY